MLYAFIAAAFCGFLYTDRAQELLAALFEFDRKVENAVEPFLGRKLDLTGITAGPLFGYLIFFVCWHGYGALLSLFDAFPLFIWSQYKRSDVKKERETYWSMLPNVLSNQLQLLVAFIVVWALGGLRITPENSQPAPDGTSTPMPPSVSHVLFHTLLNYLVYETIFFWTHWLMHIPSLYYLHKKHHDTYAAIGISGQYQGAIDFLLTTSVALGLGPLMFGTHPMACWLLAIIGGLNSVHSHAGYDFPLMPSTKEHTLHHYNYKVNFGTGPWDWLLGTYRSG